ncbi:MAG: flippase-like domain-containing protein [Chloroflexi bacterium]|nr:flippase-like domain-containing protein [Chloroflexota bacterium]
MAVGILAVFRLAAGLRQGRAARWARFLLGAVASVGLGWLALHQMDWREVYHTFKDFPVSSALLGALAFGAAMVLRACRWYVLFVVERVSLRRLFLVQNAGIGLNNLLPVRALSEPIQFLLITRRDGISGETAFATLVTANVLDIFASALMMGLGVLLYPPLQGISIQLFGAFILSIVTLLVLVLVLVVRGAGGLPFVGRLAVVRRVVWAMNALKRERLRLTLSFFATAGHWVFLGVGGWVLARGLGMNVALGALVVIFVATDFFTSAVPSLPGAAGTFEFAVIYTLGLFSVGPGPAFAFAVVAHLIKFLPSVVIALVLLPKEGFGIFGRRPVPSVAVSEAAGPGAG